MPPSDKPRFILYRLEETLRRHPAAALSFERLVLQLLVADAAEHGRRFEPAARVNDLQVDGIAHDGIDDLPGPTLVEIKYLRRYHLAFLIETLDRTLVSAAIANCPSVLLVIGARIPSEYRTALKNHSKSTTVGGSKVSVKFWDLRALAPLLERHSEFLSQIFPELAETALKNVVAKSLGDRHRDWQSMRETQMDEVRRAYRRNELVLFLGAGISHEAGLPTWNTLLSRLLVAMIGAELPEHLSATDKEKTAMAQDLQNLHSASPLLEARYIRKGLGDAFGDVVGRSVYEGLPADGPVTSATLNAIARLCIPRRDGPGIRAIVTYNFDDLLEQHLKDVGVKPKPVYREGEVVAPDELGVFHVHGFLPRETSSYDGLSESLLIFSEEGYHEVYLDAYSWSNMVQLGFLRDAIGLFVGLSITDPNLRRLLDIAAKKSKAAKHFAVLKRQLLSDFRETSALSESRPEVVEAFLSAHHVLQEKSFEELGLKTVWLQDYGEIPTLLNSIRN